MRTIDDWLRLAREVPEDLAECLEQARALCEQCWEWRALLAGLGDPPLGGLEAARAIADQTLAAAKTEVEVWGFRDVASARLLLLKDEAGARAALAAGIEALPDEPAYLWTLLAVGYAELFADTEGVRRCLDRGEAGARAPDDLCSIATARAELLHDLPGARALAERAHAHANGRDWWTVANTWKALGDSARAAAVIHAATVAADTTDQALVMARAADSHELNALTMSALDRAEALARSPNAWLALAETAYDLEPPSTRRARVVRALARALERALEGNPDVEILRRIAAAHAQWLNDPETADRIAPRGVRPDALRPQRHELEAFSGSACSLFDWLREGLSDEQRADIAKADYGQDYAKHLAALDDICQTGCVPPELAWEPGEVLRLCRWAEGDTVDHRVRGFCVTLLCLCSSQDSLANDVPILIESALALGDPAPELAEQLLVWCYETQLEDEPDGFTALWGLAVLLASRAPEDPRLEALARIAKVHPSSAKEQLEFTQRQALWAALSELAFGSPEPGSSGANAAWARLSSPD